MNIDKLNQFKEMKLSETLLIISTDIAALFKDDWVRSYIPDEVVVIESIEAFTDLNHEDSERVYDSLMEGDVVKALLKLGLSVDEVDLILPKYIQFAKDKSANLLVDFDQHLKVITDCLRDEGL